MLQSMIQKKVKLRVDPRNRSHRSYQSRTNKAPLSRTTGMAVGQAPTMITKPIAYVESVPGARVASQTSNGSVLRRCSANMPRERWCVTHSVLCLLIGACSFWIVTVDAGMPFSVSCSRRRPIPRHAHAPTHTRYR